MNMVKGLLGKKLNMGSTYDSHNRWSPITNVLIEPNLVVQVKEIDKDGYKAAQIGVGKEKHPTKSLIGHFKKATVLDAPKFLKEVPFDGELSLGQEIKVSDVFKKGEFVDVVGTSKGKGFAGVVKRHGFAGGPRTHGQSDRERAPGSIGAATTPGRVLKGTRMAGHMGFSKVTARGLEIIEIDNENSILKIKGSIPGPSNSVVLIKKSSKRKKDYHEPEAPTVPFIKQSDGATQESKEEISNKPVGTNKEPELTADKVGKSEED